MEESLPADLLEQLRELGQALDIGKLVSVYDGGRVDFSDVGQQEEIDYVEREATRGSGAGSGKRAERPRRSSGGAWPSHQAPHFRAESARALYSTDAQSLTEYYSASFIEDELGIWVAAKGKPLGRRGPCFHFLVALPFNQTIMPRAWAFRGIGNSPIPAGLRHTNFPDASICAFTKDNQAWDFSDGIVRLLDLYSVWTLKQLHLSVLGWWPGPQVGQLAFYRRLEFRSRERCGCLSGKRYGDCHQATDLLTDQSIGREEFRRSFACDFEDRHLPGCITQAARSRWKKLPSIREAYSFRPLDAVR